MSFNASFSKTGLQIKKKESTELVQAKDRIIIVFDDSGSMNENNKMKIAKQAVQDFILNKALTTAVGLMPLNATETQIKVDKVMLLAAVDKIEPTGCTPLWEALHKASHENITRVILFSDGGATDSEVPGLLVAYKRKNIPIDAIYIGPMDYHVEIMKRIASETSGIFMHFTDMNAFKKAFMFLLPEKREQLMLPGKIEELGGRS